MHVLTFLPLLLGASTTATLIHTEFPHLLIPLKSTSPDTHFGTAPDATVSYSVRPSPQFSTLSIASHTHGFPERYGRNPIHRDQL